MARGWRSSTRTAAGSAPFGLGWRLPLRTIARRLDFGVPGTGTAERWRDGGEELVETPDGSYAAARESAFTRYRRSRRRLARSRSATASCTSAA